MATLNAVILPAKALKGGKHKIRISVAHNGEFRYIPTDIIISSAKEFKNGQIVKRPDAALLNTKLRGQLQKCQRAIDELDYAEGLTCPELVYYIKNAGNDRHRTFVSVCEEYLGYANVKQSTLTTYKTTTRRLVECIGDKLLVENITHATILSLDRYLKERKLSSSSRRCYVAFLQSILKYARNCGYVNFRSDPFMAYKLPPSEVRQAWLTVDQVRAIRDYDAPTPGQALARDLFMLSYYLGGINMTDLQDIDFNANVHRLRYARKKTDTRQKPNKYVEFDIPQEALGVIERRKGDDGRLNLSEKQRSRCCNSLFALHLPKIAEALGIPRLIYYSARKSFSQHAFQIGVGEGTIEYLLGHRIGKSGSCLYNYISVTPELATEAVKKVLDNLR